MHDDRLSMIVGLVLLPLICAAVVAVLIIGDRPLRPSMHFQVEFDYVGQLRPGAKVKMANMTIGRVKHLSFKEKIVEHEDWPAGVRVVTQLGVDGYRVRRYRVQWQGSQAWREVTEDVYPATPQVVELGTNKAMSAQDFDPPAGDTHKPYQADKRIKFYMDENGNYQKIIANW